MNIIRYVLFYLFVLVTLLLFFYSDKKDYNYLIHEEAIPIRDYDDIKGMKYTIQFDKSINDKNISIASRILSSIYHYKDVKDIDNFFIDLDVDDNYKVESIYLIDKRNNYIIKNINYEKNDSEIILNLDRDIFANYETYYDIKINFKKNTRKI